jgi:hypothetical protein
MRPTLWASRRLLGSVRAGAGNRLRYSTIIQSPPYPTDLDRRPVVANGRPDASTRAVASFLSPERTTVVIIARAGTKHPVIIANYFDITPVLLEL